MRKQVLFFVDFMKIFKSKQKEKNLRIQQNYDQSEIEIKDYV